MSQSLEAQLVDLQTKVAFQEEAIAELTAELQRHRQRLDRQQIQMEYLAKKLLALQPSQVASESEETPPPHY